MCEYVYKKIPQKLDDNIGNRCSYLQQLFQLLPNSAKLTHRQPSSKPIELGYSKICSIYPTSCLMSSSHPGLSQTGELIRTCACVHSLTTTWTFPQHNQKLARRISACFFLTIIIILKLNFLTTFRQVWAARKFVFGAARVN